MNFGDLVGLLIAMSGLVAIIAVLGNSYHRRLNHKERIAELRTNASAAAAPIERTAQVERLEHRIRVLERIATDKSSTLATQIESLREPAN